MNDQKKQLEALGYYLGNLLKTSPLQRHRIEEEIKVMEGLYTTSEWKTINTAKQQILD